MSTFMYCMIIIRCPRSYKMHIFLWSIHTATFLNLLQSAGSTGNFKTKCPHFVIICGLKVFYVFKICRYCMCKIFWAPPQHMMHSYDIRYDTSTRTYTYRISKFHARNIFEWHSCINFKFVLLVPVNLLVTQGMWQAKEPNFNVRQNATWILILVVCPPRAIDVELAGRYTIMYPFRA